MTEHSARSATYQNLADATIKQVTLKPLNYSGLNQIKGLLSKLPKLETFNCSQVVVDDSVIQTITELPNLKSVNLELTPTEGISVTETMRGILKFKNIIHSLSLQHPLMTDGEMPFLPQFENLQSLFLGGATVTDIGLSFLARLNNLQSTCFITSVNNRRRITIACFIDQAAITQCGVLFRNKMQDYNNYFLS